MTSESFLASAEVDLIFRAMQGTLPGARRALFQCLIRLPLAPDDWVRAGAYAREAIASGDADERLAVIDAAPYVPVRAVRDEVVQLMAAGTNQERRRAALAFALMGDDRSVTPLLKSMSDLDDAELLATARALSQVDVSVARADVLAQSRKPSTGVLVRFWLALALARSGDDNELRQLFRALEEGRAHDRDLMNTFPGNPGGIGLTLQDLAGPSLPERTQRWLSSVAQRVDPPRISSRREDITDDSVNLGEQEQLASRAAHVAELAQALLEATDPDTRVQPGWPPGTMPGFTRYSATELASVRAQLSQLRIRDENGFVSPEALATVRALTVEPAAVTLLFEEFAQANDLANDVVLWVSDFQAAFRPDVEGLFRVYARLAQDRSTEALRWQIGWTVSRGGLHGLVRELASALASRHPEDRIAAAHLIADAADYATQEWAPLFGGGGPPAGPAVIAEPIDAIGPDAEPHQRSADPDTAPEDEPANAAVVTAPGQAVTNHGERVRRALGKPGRLLFNPPDHMQLSATARVEVRLTRALDLDDDLLADLRGPGTPHLEQVLTAPLMAVTLRGDGFSITPYSDEEQSVSADRATTWEYDITARKRGQQRLVISVSLRIPARGEPAERRSIPVREAVIDVQVRAPELMRQFFAANWRWAIGTMIAAAAVVVAVIFH